MIGHELLLLGAVGVGTKHPKVIRFRDRSDRLPNAEEETTGSVVTIITGGIYSVSALMRFQCVDGNNTVSNGWTITRNSDKVEGIVPYYILASALLPEPPTNEAQREPWVTLAWVGPLQEGDRLRVESERENPRLYQGESYDRTCFLRVIQLF